MFKCITTESKMYAQNATLETCGADGNVFLRHKLEASSDLWESGKNVYRKIDVLKFLVSCHAIRSYLWERNPQHVHDFGGLFWILGRLTHCWSPLWYFWQKKLDDGPYFYNDCRFYCSRAYRFVQFINRRINILVNQYAFLVLRILTALFSVSRSQNSPVWHVFRSLDFYQPWHMASRFSARVDAVCLAQFCVLCSQADSLVSRLFHTIFLTGKTWLWPSLLWQRSTLYSVRK